MKIPVGSLGSVGGDLADFEVRPGGSSGAEAGAWVEVTADSWREAGALSDG